MENNNLASEFRNLQLQVLSRLEKEVSELRSEVQELDKQLSTIKGQDIIFTVRKVEDKTEAIDNRLTKVETRGTILNGGIATIIGAVVAWIVSTFTGD